MYKYRSESIDLLFKAMLKLKNVDEYYAFFDDLCTISEIQSMASRIETAVCLDGGMNYLETADKAKTSSATISRVSKCLNYGSGGYRMVLDRLKEDENGK